MRLAKIELHGRVTGASICGDRVQILADWTSASGESAPFELTRLSPQELQARARMTNESFALDAVRLLPPVSPLTKLVCLGFNYRNHIEETHNDLPENPSLFTKLPDALVGQDAPILRPRVSEQFDYEGEISVVIGKAGRHIAREDALSHVFGYTIMLDGSVRDYQKHSASAGKNFWRSGALGPWIVTADEIPDPSRLSLETRLNGRTVQSTTAERMLYDIPSIIAYISRWTPLGPGDIIATGTPGGVGSRRSPPLWMKRGDTIEVEVSVIGTLRNPVRDEG